MTDPNSPEKSVSPDLLRTDMKVLMAYINSARAVSIGRETILRNIKGWLLQCLFSGLLLAAILLLITSYFSENSNDFLKTAFGDAWPSMIAGFILILVMGRTGAIASVARRVGTSTTGNIMSGDALLEMASLELGRNAFRIGIWSATIFALVVYFVFASGLPAILGFSGGLAPRFVEVERNAAADRIASLAQESFEKAAMADDAEKKCEAALLLGPEPQPKTETAEEPAAPVEPEAGATAGDETTEVAACTEAKELRKDADSAHTNAEKALDEQFEYRAAKGKHGSWTNEIAEALGVVSVPDLFKLLVWAFLAGWAEQLVPDILDTMRRKRKET
jgi:hypothetical protein